MIPERDERVNALGIKGIGEIGIVGMNAAVANAVFNATGSACASCRFGQKSCSESPRMRPLGIQLRRVS
jgi:hypothetical protein